MRGLFGISCSNIIINEFGLRKNDIMLKTLKETEEKSYDDIVVEFIYK